MTQRFAAPRSRHRWSPLLAVTTSTRRMRVLLDADCLGDGLGDRQEAPSLLWRLLHREDVDRWSYSRYGPPEGIQRRHVESADVVACADWVMVKSLGSEVDYAFAITWIDERITQNVVSRAELANEPPLRPPVLVERKSPLASAEDESDALLVRAAMLLEADLLITRRPVLDLAAGSAVTVATPEEALPLVGLYFRTRGLFLGDFWLGTPNVTYVLGRRTFYDVGCRALVPESRRWFDACLKAPAPQESTGLTHLAWAALRRIAKTLQYRDDLLRAVNHKHESEDADDAVEALEVCLTLLMGALDSTARVAHQVLGLAGPSRHAGWQKEAWLKMVAAESPSLASLVEAGTRGWAIVQVVSKLRNTMHTTSLPPMTVSGYRQPPPFRRSVLAQIPPEPASSVREPIEMLGGPTAWGLHVAEPGWLRADPDVFLERLLPEVIGLLNEIMASTPMESRLSYVPPEAPDLLPQPHDDWTRSSVMLQLGIGEASRP